MAERNLDDYNDVVHRIAEFREKHPNGSLRGDWRMERAGELSFIAYRGEAWRTPDDLAPGVGCAWELVPGRTPFTRGSELQNAETSAWGRAIIAVGAADAKKGIASRDEVEARQAERTPAQVTGAEHERLRYGTVEATPEDRPAERLTAHDVAAGADPWAIPPNRIEEDYQPEDRPGSIDPRGAQMRNLQRLFHQLGIDDRAVRLGMTSDLIGRQILTATQLSQVEAAHVIEKLKERVEATP